MKRLRVLVFAAHPDDAEFGAGGTLLRMQERCHLTICTLTNGGAGTHGDAPTRQKEQESAAAYLGAKLRLLGKADCSVEYTRQAAFELAQIIREEQPDIVMAPHWNQRGDINDSMAHPDHVHLGMLARDATRFARFRIPQLSGEPHCAKQVWYYMVPPTVQATIVLPVDDLLPLLRELWAMHHSQLALRDNSIIEHLLHMRGAAAEQLRGVHYAELIASDGPIRADLLGQVFSSNAF